MTPSTFVRILWHMNRVARTLTTILATLGLALLGRRLAAGLGTARLAALARRTLGPGLGAFAAALGLEVVHQQHQLLPGGDVLQV